MNSLLISVLGVLLWAGQSLLWAGEPRQIQLKWSELGPRITDLKIALVLPDGTHVQGKVRGVDHEGLHLRISKTSNHHVLDKGEHVIPRKSVSFLRVTEYRKVGRMVVTTAVIGVAAGILAASYPDLYEGPAVIIVPAVAAGGLSGLAVAGYYAGKRLDKRVTEIRIVPE